MIIFVIIFWPTSRQGDYFCIFSLCQVQVDDVDHLVNVHAGDVSLIFGHLSISADHSLGGGR